MEDSANSLCKCMQIVVVAGVAERHSVQLIANSLLSADHLVMSLYIAYTAKHCLYILCHLFMSIYLVNTT